MNKVITKIAHAVANKSNAGFSNYRVLVCGNDVRVFYRGSEVASLSKIEGIDVITLDFNGWWTVTTKRVMSAAMTGFTKLIDTPRGKNAYMPKVYTKKGKVYAEYGGLVVNFEDDIITINA